MNWMCADYGGVDKFTIRKEEVPGSIDSFILSGASFRCNAYENDKKKYQENQKLQLLEAQKERREYEDKYLKKYLDDSKEAQGMVQEENYSRHILENIDLFKKECEGLGFKPGTKKFKDCVVELME